MTPFSIVQGDSPVVLGVPHAATYLPDDIAQNLNENGRKLADTDWHINQRYADLLDGVTTVSGTFHRYVIDANRDPAGESLYPSQNTTGLVPLTDFDGLTLWSTPPQRDDIARRLERFHTPYHDALQTELDRVHAIPGHAILYDCHSIRSHIPYLFEGSLPVFNIGTNLGTTCDARIAQSVEHIAKASGRSTVLNGRLKGGWTTRRYGQPATGVHAIQMELAQRVYLKDEAVPLDYAP